MQKSKLLSLAMVAGLFFGACTPQVALKTSLPVNGATARKKNCFMKLKGASHIVGGKPAKANTYEFMAAIHSQGNSSEIMCGGSLVAKNLVLTAGHCVTERSGNSIIAESSIFVEMGRYNLSSQETNFERFEVKQIIRHEKYYSPSSDAALRNDVALLVLNGNSKFKPIPVNKNHTLPYDASPITVIGWGARGEKNQNYSGKLQEVEIPAIGNYKCAAMIEPNIGRKPQLTQQHLCAGTEQGGTDHCYGDSGGPLFTVKNGAFSLVGVVSSAYGACAAPGLPGISTRVSYYVDWIKSNYPGVSLVESDESSPSSVSSNSGDSPSLPGGGTSPGPTSSGTAGTSGSDKPNYPKSSSGGSGSSSGIDDDEEDC